MKGFTCWLIGFARLFMSRWERIRLEIIFSIISETKFRFETGLLFFMSSLDNDGFFNKRVMCDTFKTSGKEPNSKDKLIIFVMEISNTSRHDFNNLVGNGSRLQDLSWEEIINFFTLFTVTGSNDVIGKLISDGGIWGTLCLRSQNFILIFSYLQKRWRNCGKVWWYHLW